MRPDAVPSPLDEALAPDGAHHVEALRTEQHHHGAVGAQRAPEGRLEFGSVGMLAIEQNAPGANIVSASDSIWYIIVTISTVGYGDQYPVTNAGRIVGTVIIIRPGGSAFSWSLLLPLGLVATNAWFQVLTSKLARTESPMTMHFYTG